MPRYLRPDENGVVYGPTGFRDRAHAETWKEVAPGQIYPCDPDGGPLTPAEVHAMQPPPRGQSEAEAEYQAISEGLGFNHKPTTEECKAVLQTIEQTDPMTAIKAGLELLAMRSGLLQSVGAWEEWIWVTK